MVQDCEDAEFLEMAELFYALPVFVTSLGSATP
jgi:hypothetical protein